MVIGGGMTAVYGIIEGADAGNNHVILQEEANFLFRKIDWVLTGAAGICLPVSGTSASLTITKSIPADCMNPANLLMLDFNGNNIRLARGIQPATILNSSSILVVPDSLLFQRSAPIAGKPDAITATFTLKTMQNGRSATQDFSFTKYLHN